MSRYVMRQKFLAIGDDSWIEDEDGERVYRVDGKALRRRKTLKLEDRDGNEVCKVQERKLRIKDTMEIEAPDGERLGLIQKAMITPLRERFDVEVPDGEDLKVRGKIFDHEYVIKQGGERVAEVSKRWLRMRDIYGIEIGPGQDDVLVLAIAVALDTMEHDEPG
jgi:uncharacterized protein YxjI